MTARRTSISQKELTGYAKAMQAAGVPVWAVEVEMPDGTRIKITGGEVKATPRGPDISALLGIRNG